MPLKRLIGFLAHPVSLFGAALTTVSAVLFLATFLLDVFGFFANPYIGLLVFVALPALFLIGLVCIPVGVVLRRRQPPEPPPEGRWPKIDLNDSAQRRIVGILLVATLANAVLLSMGTMGGIHYMESQAFCGQVCHVPMQPQFESTRASPHAKVSCAACHVGVGAESFVETKLRGTQQLYAVVTDTFPRPIRASSLELRPARDTCEQCHWPEKFHGERLLEVREYAEDETNSETVTRLHLLVGGGSETLGVATGIHWHMNVGHEIEYFAADDPGAAIPYLKLTDPGGAVREYMVDGFAREALAGRALRRMDCMDCHNRAAHAFAASPERAVDRALAIGRLSKDLPFIRREAVSALQASYASRDEAAAEIASRLQQFYGQADADQGGDATGAVAQAIRITQDLWAENVFPAMNVQWGTYPSQIGHTDALGCFRCHDDSHSAADGSVISQDCELCHRFE